jgi:hypothetical protein
MIKESSMSAYAFLAVILFIILFSSFLALTMSYQRVYRLKNEALNILEKYNGYTEISKGIMDSYFQTQNYSNRGSCYHDNGDSEYGGWYGVNYGEKPVLADNTTTYNYCLKRITITTEEGQTKMYYRIMFFHIIDLPIFNLFGTFRVNGTTNILYDQSLPDMWVQNP